ncbi:hypothetical protein KUCAC02_003091 [Chaenocephalus aceratus]|uniref:Uncharacterized protein n=1 Tax=Chaenocephalus aceratus TaxID=36190 RepID=A0ACB9WKI5_CHAAC|nr:hypothetical protein KUCAC02_003091 [Chaenocephalus aceratus]
MGLCFITQTPLSQDDELALMAGYAAAMDASMSEASSTQDVTAAMASGPSSPPDSSEPQGAPVGWAGPRRTGRAKQERSWNTPRCPCVCLRPAARRDEAASSRRVPSCSSSSGRRHQRKDPGMSQSHNDLVYLESPAAVERGQPHRHAQPHAHPQEQEEQSQRLTSTGEPHV